MRTAPSFEITTHDATQPAPTSPSLTPEPDVTETGFADALLARHPDDLRYVPETGSWLVWQNGWTSRETDRALHQLTLAMLRDFANVHRGDAASQAQGRRARKAASRLAGRAGIRNIIACAASQTPHTVSPEQLDAEPHLLGARNGIIDLASGTLQPYEREHLITHRASVDYNPHATCPRWLRFLTEVFDGDHDVISYIQRVFGYALTGDTSLQQMWLLTGPGSNGKSTLVGTLTRLLGSYAQQTPDTVLLSTRSGSASNDLARLRGIRTAVLTETGQSQLLNETRVKALVSGDTISARYLYQEFFDFRPTAKFFLLTNYLPNIHGADHGIWRRLVVIPFTRTFEVGSDQTLDADLLAELPGILAWAVAGAMAYLANPACLPLPERLQRATNEYRAEEDLPGQFLAECVTRDPAHSVSAKDLRDRYVTWCQQNGHQPLSPNELGGRLRSHGLERQRRGKGNRWHWNGASLPPEDETEDPNQLQLDDL